ncbi:hypothetical protein D5086_029300 [Populus alba]|uniref:Uncharacterized protein n=1 Tax=Populus alba TaxID=43335 RepID=A0ACC4AT45_POPAL
MSPAMTLILLQHNYLCSATVTPERKVEECKRSRGNAHCRLCCQYERAIVAVHGVSWHCKLAKGLLLPLLKRSSQTLPTLTFAFTIFTTYIIVGRNARLIFFSSLFSYVVCSSCRETIKAIYGSHSKELDNFNRSLRSFEQIWAIILLCHKEKGLKKVENWSSLHVHSTVQQYDTTRILDTGKIIKGKAWLPFRLSVQNIYGAPFWQHLL